VNEAVRRAWAAIAAFLQFPLISIGEAAVTVGGLLRVLVALGVAVVASRLVRSALLKVSGGWAGTGHATLYSLSRVIHYTFIGIGLAVGLSTIGVDLTNLAVLLGALGIGIGFGLQDSVANLIAGVMLLFERHVRVGDFLELESGVIGEVREIRMRATRIVTNDNVDILVPNSEFVRGRVMNWTLGDVDRRVHVPFGVAYGADKERVRAAVLAAAERVPYTLRGKPHRDTQVWLVRFGESSLDFELVVWLTDEGVKRPYHAQARYLWEIHSALLDAGIEIPFPQRDLHVRSVFGLDGDQAQRFVHGERSPSRNT